MNSVAGGGERRTPTAVLSPRPATTSKGCLGQLPARQTLIQDLLAGTNGEASQRLRGEIWDDLAGFLNASGGVINGFRMI